MLPMTYFCNKQIFSEIIVGPHSGTQLIYYANPGLPTRGYSNCPLSGTSQICHIPIMPQSFFEVSTSNDGILTINLLGESKQSQREF
jgi:hypothetical protein